MDLIKNMLSDGKDISAMRVMSLFSLLMGSIIASYGLYIGKDLPGVAELTAVFVISAFGGKVAQKVSEDK